MIQWKEVVNWVVKISNYGHTTKRNINEEFKASLYEILRTKPIPPELLEKYFSELILSFSNVKRITTVKKPSYSFEECWDKLIEEFDESGYTVFISARPYELENDPNEFFTELRDKTIKDLASNLFSPSFKKYRYNIPSKEVGKILWRRIHTLLCKYFNAREDFEDILDKLKAEGFAGGFNKNESEEIQIRRLAAGFLQKINKDGILWVFVNSAPIYVCPQIHLNPNQPYNSSDYIYFNSSEDAVNIYRFNKAESYFWQEQVWFKMKETNLAESLLFEHDFIKPLNEPL